MRPTHCQTMNAAIPVRERRRDDGRTEPSATAPAGELGLAKAKHVYKNTFTPAISRHR